MQKSNENDSMMIDSMSGSQDRSRTINQDQSESRFLSNRQKILNLHQRIKMLDHIGTGNKQQRSKLQLWNKDIKKQVKFEEHTENISNENLRKVVSEKAFLRKQLNIKPTQMQANIQKLQQEVNFSRQNINSPFNQHENSNKNFDQQIGFGLQNKQTLINSSNHHESPSASIHLPSIQLQKNQAYQSQNVLSSYYRPVQSNDLFPLEARYLSIEDKFLQFKMSQENLLANIDGEIRELQENCKKLKKQYEKTEKRNQQTIDSLEKSLICQIAELSAELKQVKKGAIQSLDTKHKAIRCETIAMIAEDFESQCKLASTQIQTQLETTLRLLQKQENLRDQTAQFLINSFGDQIIKLQEALNTQRQKRVKKNDELLKIINNIEDQLMDKIQKEKRQMIQNIETMQNMLEQVCYKIEQKILGN